MNTGEAEAAPSLKLSFFNPAYDAVPGNDGFMTLIFEPYWNQPGHENTSTPPPTGDWSTYTVNLDNGLLWSNGGFGTSNSAGGGGPSNKTLSEWESTLDPAFLDAHLVALTIGVGTYNLGQVGYFDKVVLSGTTADNTYDFRQSPFPPPSHW